MQWVVWFWPVLCYVIIVEGNLLQMDRHSAVMSVSRLKPLRSVCAAALGAVLL